jgi:hypothetical protein
MTLAYFKAGDQSLVGRVARAAFPGNAKDFAVAEFRGPMNVNSYWDGGSRDEYRLVDLRGLRVWAVPSTHPFYDRKEDGTRCGSLELNQLPPDTCLVAGGTFLGKPATVQVYLREDNLVDLLPRNVEMPAGDWKALDVIASHKGGIHRQEAFSRAGLGKYGPENPHVRALADRGLVKINKAGAVTVTTEGMNARLAARGGAP